MKFENVKNYYFAPSYILSLNIVSSKSNITKILTIYKVNIQCSIQSWQTPWNILYNLSNTSTAHVFVLIELLNDKGPVPAPNIFILGTYIELVDSEMIVNQKELLVYTVRGVPGAKV